MSADTDNPGSALSVSNSMISGNAAYDGGGLENFYTLTVNNSTVSGNTAQLYGGGIDNVFGTLTVSKSTISNNTAQAGGGIANDPYFGAVSVTSTQFINKSPDNCFGC